MKENQQDLRQEAVEDLERLGESLRADGVDSRQIQRIIEDTIKRKMKQKFKDKDKSNEISSIIHNLMLEHKNPDSKSEILMAEILHRADIEYEFQKEIGRYTVDFFIPPDYILEVDGPHHQGEDQVKHDETRDDWFRKMGYKIFRMDTSSMFIVPTSRIIENLNEFLGRAEW